MSEADRSRWSARYAQDSGGPGAPEPFVLEVLEVLKPDQTMLELAGGLGRHALAFAKAGHRAYLSDIAPEALLRAERAAASAGLALKTLAFDLDEPWERLRTWCGPVDVVVLGWFLLTPPMWAELPSLLRAGGRLVVVHPTRANLERHPRPSARFLLEAEALRMWATQAGFRMLRYEEGWDARGHFTARMEACLTAPGDR